MTSPLDAIPTLAAWLAAAGIDELHLSGPEGEVRLRRGGAAGPATPDATPAPETPAEADEIVRSPGVGHVLHAHPLRAEPLVAPDEAVTEGQPLALLRVGTLLLPVPAPRDGTVAAILAADETLVGYGDPLVSLWPPEA